jgi:EAL domain-containing protein (putative c-di-GMP-specific phosphodiesterase class I)
MQTSMRHLAGLRAALQGRVDGVVETFFDHLPEDDPGVVMLARLTPDGLADLKRSHAEHLLALLDPDTAQDAHHARGREAGRVLAMVGVDLGWYARALSAHQARVIDVIGDLPEQDRQPWLYAVVAERFGADLQGALAGYREVEEAQHRGMGKVTEAVARAGTVADLVRGVLGACTEVEGLAIGLFGRVDENGRFQYEMGVGTGAETFMAEVSARPPRPVTAGDDAGGQGPSGRAWRTGSVQRSDDYLADPTTAPWRELGARLGWRSSVAVPFVDGRGEPRALLALYSYWPGFFAAPSRQAMLVQLKHVVERALMSLEVRGAVTSGVRTYAARTAYLSLLDAGQVEMLFQPIVELRTGRLSKVEALARLKGESRLVPPGEFLPALGDEELVRLFETGLDQSLRVLQRWDRQGLSVGVALNLPAVSSQDERYVDIVERGLARHRTEPSRLTLELMETGYVHGRPRWRAHVLDQFKALGVRLAQDDLGSGYSSLLRLRHFAFDDVKLDQDLIRGQAFDPRGALNFIQPLTSLAHSMGLAVTVEGLEDDGLIEAALMLGADAGQGYGLSRPMAAEEVPAWAQGFRLGLDPEQPRTALGGLAAHVAWEHRVTAMASATSRPALLEDAECPLACYIAALDDRGGHLAEAHAAVHRATRNGRGTADHMRWWRVLTKMLAGRR